ncbi:MAG: hypothetical protein N3E46_03105 [Gemmataceae bacterium]|nr:hypothetical protein [Gemmataceae bacterium]
MFWVSVREGGTGFALLGECSVVVASFSDGVGTDPELAAAPPPSSSWTAAGSMVH